MSDIIERLRRWTHAVDAAPASDLMDEAADEIKRLRKAIRRLADQDATLSVCSGTVTVTMDASLTDAELEAVERAAAFADDAAGYCKNPANADAARKQAATLRGLLERMK